MTPEQWEALRIEHGGKQRVVTTDEGRVIFWKWGCTVIPDKARFWTIVGAGLPWTRFDQEDMNYILGREWQAKQFGKARSKATHRRYDTGGDAQKL